MLFALNLWQIATKKGADADMSDMLDIITLLVFYLSLAFLSKEIEKTDRIDSWTLPLIIYEATMFDILVYVLVWVLNPAMAKDLIKIIDLRVPFLLWATTIACGIFLYKIYRKIKKSKID